MGNQGNKMVGGSAKRIRLASGAKLTVQPSVMRPEAKIWCRTLRSLSETTVNNTRACMHRHRRANRPGTLPGAHLQTNPRTNKVNVAPMPQNTLPRRLVNLTLSILGLLRAPPPRSLPSSPQASSTCDLLPMTFGRPMDDNTQGQRGEDPSGRQLPYSRLFSEGQFRSTILYLLWKSLAP